MPKFKPSQFIPFGKTDQAYDDLHSRHKVLKLALEKTINSADIETARTFASRALGEDAASEAISKVMLFERRG